MKMHPHFKKLKRVINNLRAKSNKSKSSLSVLTTWNWPSICLKNPISKSSLNPCLSMTFMRKSSPSKNLSRISLTTHKMHSVSCARLKSSTHKWMTIRGTQLKTSPSRYYWINNTKYCKARQPTCWSRYSTPSTMNRWHSWVSCQIWLKKCTKESMIYRLSSLVIG